MSTKHNSAPWWVTESGIRNREGYICHTTPVTHFPGQDDRHTKETAEREASKVLMAAAPDLLGALQSLLTAYQTVHGIGDLEMQPAIFFARKCIAAATGETA